MKIRTTGLFYALLAVGGSLTFAAPASAQATRTWVSGVGDDVNPCSRTAPCKTFQGTISKTAAGGEINCLDPAGFGAVTITKSITIRCDFTTAGVLVAAQHGVIVNAAATDTVVLSGLDFEGFGQGLFGVRILQAGNVVIRNSSFRGFRGVNGGAIGFQPASTGASLTVDNVTIVNNVAATNDSGAIVIAPAANVAATFALNDVRVTDNNGFGLGIITDTVTGASVKGTVTNSLFTDNTSAGIIVQSSTTPLQLLVKDTVINGGGLGLVAGGAGASVQVSGSKITQTTTALTALTGASLTSFGDNIVADNVANGSFTGPATKQ
jgi:hypothetical protein